MGTTAKLDRDARNFDHTDTVGVLVSEKGERAKCERIFVWHVCVFGDTGSFSDLGVDLMLYLLKLFRGDPRKVAEVETQAFRRDQRTLLLDMLPEYLAERGMQKVGRSVVPFCCNAGVTVNRSFDGNRAGQFDVGRGDCTVTYLVACCRDDMDDQFAVLARIGDLEKVSIGFNGSGVTYLAAAFGVKRGTVQHKKELVAVNPGRSKR